MTTYPEQIRVLDLGREVMNFPSRELANATAPDWFTVSANATLTEVGATAAVSDETYGTRALKVVTTATAAYAAQRLTYADQPRVKSGRKAFMQYAVWSVSAVPARIRLQSSVGSLAVSGDTTAAAWTVLTLPQVTLNGTYTEIRMEVDNGTAYFIPLSPVPRGVNTYHLDTPPTIKTLTGLGDEATWTDIDVTSNTSNLACRLHARVAVAEGVSQFRVNVRRNGSSESANNDNEVAFIDPNTQTMYNDFPIILDSGQIFEYFLDRTSGSSTLDFGEIYATAYDAWA